MASDVGQFFVFGDSTSDMGSFFKFVEGVIPQESNPFPLLYPSERLSNGPVWVEYLTDKLNITIDPFITSVETDPVTGQPGTLNFEPSENSGGVNFAIGSATSGTDNTSGIVPIGLEEQMDIFGR